MLFTALITWLPLALLTLIEGNPSDVKLTFLHDIEAHVRFLVAVPVLIEAELIVPTLADYGEALRPKTPRGCRSC
jgi:hypothetical protein